MANRARFLRGIAPSLIVLAVWVAWPQSAAPIPAFARRYQVSCTLCHVAFPKLNSFGMAFRNNGYRMPVLDQRLAKIRDVELGAEPWKDLWPRAVWPGALPGVVPLALRIVLDANVNPDAEAQLAFDMPHEIELLAAGTAGSTVSFLAHVDFFGRDDSVKLERAFIQFDSIADKKLLNVKAGRFEVGAVPFSRFHRRMSTFGYATSEFSLDEEGFALEYAQDGVEVWGARNGWGSRGGFNYALGIVNGGMPEVDTNGAKDWYYRAAYKIGGNPVTGPPADATELPLQMSDNWRDDSVRIGTYGYRGETPGASLANSFERYGVDVDLWYRNVNVYGTWMTGKERKGQALQFDIESYFVEADYVAFPWLHPFVRYEVSSYGGHRAEDWVFGAVALIRANLRLVGDGRWFVDGSGDSAARFRLDLGF